MLTTGGPPLATACSASDTSYGDVTWAQWDAQRQNSKSLQHKPLPRPSNPLCLLPLFANGGWSAKEFIKSRGQTINMPNSKHQHTLASRVKKTARD